MRNLVSAFTLLLPGILLGGCTGVPDGIRPVDSFDSQRYLGKWYEVARLDHRFERGLTRVTAEYSRRDDGGIRVVNRGYDPRTHKWKQAVGRAYPIKDNHTGRLKVAFFGPFYAAYNIIALDTDHYQYALVCGPNRRYLWILSRTPTLPDQTLDALVRKAGHLGFPVGQLVYVHQLPPTQGS